MKTKKLILAVLIFIATGLHAQTYIQGKSVVPFHEMAESDLIRQSNRISSGDALRLYNERIDPRGRKDSVQQLFGEFWLIDNLLVRIVGRKLSHPPTKWEDLEENRRYSSFEIGITVERYVDENTRSYTLEMPPDYYFDEIKTVNNFDVLVHCFKDSPYKDFLIRDKGNRYILLGGIYSTGEQKEIKKSGKFYGPPAPEHSV